jgi:kelch-like protein 18
MSRFHPNNVLGIRSFADTLGCYALIAEADRYIHQYFHDVSVADE